MTIRAIVTAVLGHRPPSPASPRPRFQNAGIDIAAATLAHVLVSRICG
jgi:hypothetical protein